MTDRSRTIAAVLGSNAGGGSALAAVLRAQAATMNALADELDAGVVSASPPATEEIPVTLADLAKACGVSSPTMKKELTTRGISGLRVGDHPRYLVSEVRAALRQPAPNGARG